MPDVTISALPPEGMLSIRADLSDLQDKITDSLGLSVPARLGVSTAGMTSLLWLSPDELLLICPSGDVDEHRTHLEDALAGFHYLVADVSDMRAGFKVSGPRVREVLSKLVPIDLHPNAFGPGQIRRTHLAQVPAALWMTDAETARVLCFRSVADYVSSCLIAAADPHASVDL